MLCGTAGPPPDSASGDRADARSLGAPQSIPPNDKAQRTCTIIRLLPTPNPTATSSGRRVCGSRNAAPSEDTDGLPKSPAGPPPSRSAGAVAPPMGCKKMVVGTDGRERIAGGGADSTAAGRCALVCAAKSTEWEERRRRRTGCRVVGRDRADRERGAEGGGRTPPPPREVVWQVWRAARGS